MDNDKTSVIASLTAINGNKNHKKRTHPLAIGVDASPMRQSLCENYHTVGVGRALQPAACSQQACSSIHKSRLKRRLPAESPPHISISGFKFLRRVFGTTFVRTRPSRSSSPMTAVLMHIACFAADPCLLNFDLAGQFAARLTVLHRLTDALEHEPSRLLRDT
jgi:hypothetical protein